MKKVKDYIEEGRIKRVTENPGKARSLLERSKKRLENLKDRDLSKGNAFLTLENAYESIREAIESSMASEGFKSRDHVATIAWGAEKLELPESETNRLHKLRKLRNASRYEAEEITSEQAREAIEFGERFIEKIG